MGEVLAMLKLFGILDLVPGWAYMIAIAMLSVSSWAMGWAWLSARDRVASLVVERDQAIGAASQCSESVANLQRLAAKRQREGRPAIAAAAKTAQVAEQRADQILAAPPSTPGDDCKSAQDQVDIWLASRGKP
jgi:hypothetical protein